MTYEEALSYLENYTWSKTRLGLGRTRELVGKLGDPQKKLSLMLDWCGESRDVADPWYTHDFEATWQDVLRGCTALLEHMAAQNGWTIR